MRATPWGALLGVVRPRFLTLALLSALLGIASAGSVDASGWWPALIVLGAIAAHASVNAFNEVMDAQSGLDDHTQRTPFSGGSGTLQQFPSLLSTAHRLAWSLLVFTVLVGVLIWSRVGAGIVPLGLLGALLIYFYTQHINRHAWATLLAPGLAFGPLMICGACYAMQGQITALALVTSVPVACWVSNILLLAQVPDAAADAQAGRRHLVITHGPRFAMRVYGALQALSVICLGIAVWQHWLPPSVSYLAIALPAVLWLAFQVLRQMDNLHRYVPLIGLHVLLTHALMLALWLLLR